MLKKLAVIRGITSRSCPFGLDLTNLSPCKIAGAAVNNMQPLAELSEDKQEACKVANRRVFRHYANGEKCPYADNIIESKGVVNCDHDEEGGSAGVKEVALPSSRIYPSIFGGTWSVGLFSAPISFYEDNFNSREIFAGIYNIYSRTGEIHIRSFGKDPDPLLIELLKI